MMTSYLRIDLTHGDQKACTLSGHMRTHSTAELHTHSGHQVLRISDGVSLLVDQTRKQPLFAGMTALIPADLPHRSTVIGRGATYRSLYIAPDLLAPLKPEIVIFNVSPLGAALLHRIVLLHPEDLSHGFNRECLDLFLKILPEDMARPLNLVRLPEPHHPFIREVIGFIETHYKERLTTADFEAAFPYCGRHLSRLFKSDLKITLFDYLRIYRVLMASIAMLSSTRPITEIAFDCGYESLSSFYRDFNLIHAVTPKRFRRNLLSSDRLYRF